jgi:hypothetical protein
MSSHELSPHEFEFGLDTFIPVTVDQVGEPISGDRQTTSCSRRSPVERNAFGSAPP